jgi:hypothetical protein
VASSGSSVFVAQTLDKRIVLAVDGGHFVCELPWNQRTVAATVYVWPDDTAANRIEVVLFGGTKLSYFNIIWGVVDTKGSFTVDTPEPIKAALITDTSMVAILNSSFRVFARDHPVKPVLGAAMNVPCRELEALGTIQRMVEIASTGYCALLVGSQAFILNMDDAPKTTLLGIKMSALTHLKLEPDVVAIDVASCTAEEVTLLVQQPTKPDVVKIMTFSIDAKPETLLKDAPGSTITNKFAFLSVKHADNPNVVQFGSGVAPKVLKIDQETERERKKQGESSSSTQDTTKTKEPKVKKEPRNRCQWCSMLTLLVLFALYLSLIVLLRWLIFPAYTSTSQRFELPASTETLCLQIASCQVYFEWSEVLPPNLLDINILHDKEGFFDTSISGSLAEIRSSNLPVDAFGNAGGKDVLAAVFATTVPCVMVIGYGDISLLNSISFESLTNGTVPVSIASDLTSQLPKISLEGVSMHFDGADLQSPQVVFQVTNGEFMCTQCHVEDMQVEIKGDGDIVIEAHPALQKIDLDWVNPCGFICLPDGIFADDSQCVTNASLFTTTTAAPTTTTAFGANESDVVEEDITRACLQRSCSGSEEILFDVDL